jgi:hypothetical protein
MAFTYDPLELEVGYIRLLTLQPSPDPLAKVFAMLSLLKEDFQLCKVQ